MKKIGRNEPCPCGSGKKFKKCHLGREDKIMLEGSSEISVEMSARITGLPSVNYGRSREMIDALDVKELTGSAIGIRFIDLKRYNDLDLFGSQRPRTEEDSTGGVLVNVLKTSKSDPDNVYVAISSRIGDSILVHQLAHVLDSLGGSKVMPGLARPLAFELGIPGEHLEHPHEFGYWLGYLAEKFQVQLDADDAIISYLHKNDMLIRGDDIERQDQLILKSKSDRILKFLSERGVEIDALISELPGYIGSRVGRE
jgi:hypothetical protein